MEKEQGPFLPHFFFPRLCSKKKDHLNSECCSTHERYGLRLLIWKLYALQRPTQIIKGSNSPPKLPEMLN